MYMSRFQWDNWLWIPRPKMISVLLCIIATWMRNMMTHQSNMMVFSRKPKLGPKPWWWVESKNHITTKMRWINVANQTNPVFPETNSVFIVLFQTFDLRVLGRLPICWSIHRLKLHIVGWKLPAILAFLKIPAFRPTAN